jgi:dihydroorotate dehydrogenase electron transfer subunit
MLKSLSLAHTVYQIRGIGTKALATHTPGSTIDIIGPLGNAFPEPARDEIAIIVGGGIGIGPMLFLASVFSQQSFPYELIVGFRTAASIPLRSAGLGAFTPLQWNALLKNALITTDDGSEGVKGTVIDALVHLESVKRSSSRWHIYGCGPSPMLAAIARFASARGAAAHVSVEQYMACGVGACQGCVIRAAAGGYYRVCADGPVFSANTIDWTGNLA